MADGVLATVDCAPSVGGGCFLSSKPNALSHVFGGLGPGTHPATAALQTFSPSPADVLFLAIGDWDWNADGRRDVALVHATATLNALDVAFAPVDATTSPVPLDLPQIVAGPNGGGLPVGDLDGDGLADFATGFGSSILVRYSSDLQEPPVRSIVAPEIVTIDQLAVADIDGDGFDDILLQIRYDGVFASLEPPLFVVYGNGI
ncbi:MAG: hypothetical protein R3F61_38325 [Myxococcota bacterium]